MPLHDPVLALSVCPSVTVPDMTGAAVLAGATAATTPLAADVLDADPAEFDAVTATLIVSPT